MSKNTFGKAMPGVLEKHLQLMGEQIMLARKRRHLSMQDIADRATVTRLTVSKVARQSLRQRRSEGATPNCGAVQCPQIQKNMY